MVIWIGDPWGFDHKRYLRCQELVIQMRAALLLANLRRTHGNLTRIDRLTFNRYVLVRLVDFVYHGLLLHDLDLLLCFPDSEERSNLEEVEVYESGDVYEEDESDEANDDVACGPRDLQPLDLAGQKNDQHHVLDDDQNDLVDVL